MRKPPPPLYYHAYHARGPGGSRSSHVNPVPLLCGDGFRGVAMHIYPSTYRVPRSCIKSMLPEWPLMCKRLPQESLGNMKIPGSHPCCYRQLRMRSRQMFGLETLLAIVHHAEELHMLTT